MSRIDRLALPKHSSSFCVLCKKPGIERCNICKVTYYCGKKHKELDYKAFHRLICEEVAFIQGEHPFPIEKKERQAIMEELTNRKRLLRKRAEDVTRELLLKDKPDLAFAPAMQVLHLVKDLSEEGELQEIIAFALLAEVFLGLDNVSLAEDYMIQAAWTSQRKDLVPIQAAVTVQRIKGLVFLKKKLFSKANEAFAEYVYYLAEKGGTADVPIACGFAYLGLTIKALEQNAQNSLNLFNKMGFMWIDELLDWYASKNLKVPSVKEMEDAVTRENEFLFLEAQNVIKLIEDSITDMITTPVLDRLNFKLFIIQVMTQMRQGNKDNKKLVDKALIVAGRTRMDDAVCERKRTLLNEVLGCDYIDLWYKKNRRPKTIATKYLESVKSLNKSEEVDSSNTS